MARKQNRKQRSHRVAALFGGGGARRRKQPRRQRMYSAGVVAMPRQVVADTARRRKRRQQGRQLRSTGEAIARVVWSARWLSLLLAALSIYALSQIGLDERYYMRRVPVEGVRSIPPSEIVEGSGIAGKHIFAVDPTEAARRIDGMPGVISATVDIAWPNQVRVRVVEDTPIAVWIQDGVDYWVNADGHIFPSRGVKLPGLLEIVSELPAPAPDPEADGEQTTPDAADPEAMMARLPLQFVPQDVLRGALQLRQLQPALTRFYYRPDGGLSFDSEQGWRVYMGTGDDMVQKLVVYDAVVLELQGREVTPSIISVSNQRKPFYRLGP